MQLANPCPPQIKSRPFVPTLDLTREKDHLDNTSKGQVLGLPLALPSDPTMENRTLLVVAKLPLVWQPWTFVIPESTKDKIWYVFCKGGLTRQKLVCTCKESYLRALGACGKSCGTAESVETRRGWCVVYNITKSPVPSNDTITGQPQAKPSSATRFAIGLLFALVLIV